MHDDDGSTPAGLLRGLRMLANEARSLELVRTLAALQQAMETCRTEAVTPASRRSAALH